MSKEIEISLDLTTNSLEERFLRTFNDLIDRFIERSPFFTEWSRDRVNLVVAERFLATFNELVRCFPGLIAQGAARADNEDMRTVLATNLYQECGEGDVQRTHHAIFRKFLATAGVSLATAKAQTYTEEWQSNLSRYIETVPNPLAALGALAAGEFLAQPVLSRIFSVIHPLYPDADIEYFTTHLELETEHVREIASLLVRQVNGGSDEDMISGFMFGLSTWENYFGHLHDHLFHAHVSHDSL